MSGRTKSNRKLAMILTGFVAGMVGLAYASVPLYQLFCQVTGYGGVPQVADAAPGAVSDRKIAVRFDANTNPKLPWRFKAVQNEISVKLGESTLAFYEAQNLSGGDVTGTALFNVTPLKAGQYFSKIECFCFTEQTLTAGQRMDMPVQFFVDPEIYDDPNTKDVTTITLSYTFYPAEPEEKSADAAVSDNSRDTSSDNKRKKS